VDFAPPKRFVFCKSSAKLLHGFSLFGLPRAPFIQAHAALRVILQMLQERVSLAHSG
jgi:hypothetical protein